MSKPQFAPAVGETVIVEHYWRDMKPPVLALVTRATPAGQFCTDQTGDRRFKGKAWNADRADEIGKRHDGTTIHRHKPDILATLQAQYRMRVDAAQEQIERRDAHRAACEAREAEQVAQARLLFQFDQVKRLDDLPDGTRLYHQLLINPPCFGDEPGWTWIVIAVRERERFDLRAESGKSTETLAAVSGMNSKGSSFRSCSEWPCENDEAAVIGAIADYWFNKGN